MKRSVVFGIALAGSVSAVHASDIIVCKFEGLSFFIATNDDHSARIGVKPGLGDRGYTFEDPVISGARVVIEFNTDGIPITMTTIKPDGDAVHSRQGIDMLGGFTPPSQLMGTCAEVH